MANVGLHNFAFATRIRPEGPVFNSNVRKGVVRRIRYVFEASRAATVLHAPRVVTLCRTFGGRAVGLSTLAVAVGEAPETVEDVYEPFLLQCGLLERTPRGRMATPSAFVHLGLHPPAAPGEAPNLF